MRLTIRDERQIFPRQTHAYAEYRAFAMLAARGDPIEDVFLTLSRRRGTSVDDSPQVVCAIAVRLRSGHVVDVEAVAARAYAAIDQAVDLLSAHRLIPPIKVRREPSRVSGTCDS